MLCFALNIYCSGSFLLGFDRHLVQIWDELLKGPVCDKLEVKMCRLDCVDLSYFYGVHR